MKSLLLLLAVLGCLAVSCTRSAKPESQTGHVPASETVATVGGHPILLVDFRAELERRAHGRSGAFARAEDREALLQEMVKDETVYLHAKEAGFDQRPEIARLIKRLIINQFKEAQPQLASELPPVNEAQIADYYQEHADSYTTAEKIHFAAIRVGFSPKATDAKKAEVIHKAETILDEARTTSSTRTFGSLAQRYSEDQATRYIGGDAGWISRGETSAWNPAVLGAAWALTNVGELGPVVTTENGCYLVKLIGKKPASHRPFDEVKDAIRYQLTVTERQRAQQEFFEKLSSGLKAEINHAALESLASPANQAETKPPATPAG